MTFLDKPMCEIIFELPNAQQFVPPEFFLSYFKLKVVDYLQSRILNFKQSFMTDAEEKWSDYITQELELAKKDAKPFAYKPADLDSKILTLAFSVIVAVPPKKEVKHSLDSLEQKVVLA